MEKLNLQSPDLTARNIEALAELFPTVVTETRDADGAVRRGIDFDLLRQELSDHVVEGPQERYRLDWPGKRTALLAANAPIRKTLRPVRDESVDFDTTKNLFIEGDNLEALKLLQESYLGKVKLIYIDPPYNTGNDFIYNDDFVETTDEYLVRSGQTDVTGVQLAANSESNGRFHSDWLSMMYPRLRLARRLLSEDGLLAVSIDDHEVANLRVLLDEVFGSANFIASVIWHKMDSPKNSARHLSEDHEYLLLYARSAAVWRPNLLPRTDDMIARYKNPDDDPRGPWLLGDLSARNRYDQGVYPIITPTGRVIDGPPPGSYWRVSEERLRQLDEDGRIWWGDGTIRPGIKRFLSEVRDGVVPQTYWSWREVGSTRNAKQDLHKLLGASAGDNIFITPKPVGLISRLIQIACGVDSLVLDFFAGSGTIAESVLKANLEDSGSRRYIAVQVAETYPSGSTFRTVSEFSMERIRRAGQRIKANGSGSSIDIGFRTLRIDSPTLAEVGRAPSDTPQEQLSMLADSVVEGRTAEDMLIHVLLDWGLELSLPIVRETVADRELHVVDGGLLIACFAETLSRDVVTAIAQRQPERAVFRDSAFATDADRINAQQVFAQLAPHTELRTV